MKADDDAAKFSGFTISQRFLLDAFLSTSQRFFHGLNRQRTAAGLDTLRINRGHVEKQRLN